MSPEEIIAEKLRESFETLRSGLANMKEAVESLAEAIPETPDFDSLAAEIAEALPEPEAPPPPEVEEKPAAPAPIPNNRLLYFIGCVEHADSQAAILKKFMEGAADFANRGILFIVKGESAMPWQGFGFDESQMSRWKVDINDDPLLRTMVSTRTRMLMDNTSPGFLPLEGATRRSMISPLLLKGKVAAFLYADSGENGKLDHYSLDILLRTTSLVVDILPLRAKRDPLPVTLENQDIILPGMEPETGNEADEDSPLFDDSGSLSTEDELSTDQTMMAEIPDDLSAAAEAEPEEEPEPEPEPEPEDEETSDPDPEITGEAEAVDEIPLVEPEESLEDSGSMEEIEPEEEIAVEEDEPSSEEDMVEMEEEEARDSEPEEEADVEEEAEPEAEPEAEDEAEEEEPIPEEEQKLHNDAQRFARLLVQEIVLYHPKEVEQGQNQKNLYSLLRDDIDRSREAFESRFSQPSVKSRNYFQKALVEHLADGDESLLG